MSAGSLRCGLAVIVGVLALASPAAATRGGGSNGPDALTIGVVPQRAYGESDTRSMRSAGIESVRAWLSWAQVEPDAGEFDWKSFDGIVETNARGGVTTLPYLFGTPAWAATMDDQPCFGSGCMAYAPRTEETRDAYAEFAAAAVRRYGPGGAFWGQHRALTPRPIEVWQIWNEQNLSSFWAPAVDPAGYGELVLAAAPAIRSEDPRAEIVLGGLTGTETNQRRMSTAAFLRRLYAVPGIGAATDGVAVHPYNRKVSGAVHQVRTARRIADAYGDDAGLWVTEFGWASAGRRRWGLVKSPNGQARVLRLAIKRLDERARRWDIRAAYWYAWRDTDRGQGVCGWCPWSGLIDRVGREKPAYRELENLLGA
jgi:Beta-galactosidase